MIWLEEKSTANNSITQPYQVQKWRYKLINNLNKQKLKQYICIIYVYIKTWLYNNNNSKSPCKWMNEWYNEQKPSHLKFT